MKRVCFFVTSLNSGGIENYLLRFLKYSNNKLDAFVICKSGFDGELFNEYRKIPNVKVVNLRLSYLNFANYIRLYTFLKKNKVQTVCDFTGNFAGIVMLVSFLVRIKNRIVFYRGSTNRFRETPFRLIYNWIVNLLVKKYATSILSNSKAALGFFFTRTDNRFNVIYNGIDSIEFNVNESKSQIRLELGIPSTAYVIGHTGRVHYSKNHETILKVANTLCTRHSDIHFVLCGKNTNTELVQMVDSKLSNQIHLLGYRSDIPRVLKAFDVYFFPSLTEGQPNSLIEAMIAGLPIVASSIEPIKETVTKLFAPDLISPLDYERFIAVLDQRYLTRNIDQSNNLKNWAIENFNPTIQFKKFYKELIS